MADAERHIQAFEHSEDTLDDLVTKNDDAEPKQKSSEEPVHLSEDEISEQSNKLTETDVSLSGFFESLLSFLKKT